MHLLTITVSIRLSVRYAAFTTLLHATRLTAQHRFVSPQLTAMHRQRWAIGVLSGWRHTASRSTARCQLFSTTVTTSPASRPPHSAASLHDNPPLLPPASSGLQLPPHTFTTRIAKPFPLSLHSTPLPYLDVNWSVVGNPTGPTIFIMPSMSHSSLVTRPHHLRHPTHPTQPTAPPALPSTPGWWESVVGWGGAYGIDLNTFQVLSASALGAPFGTTSPLSYTSSSSEPPVAYRSLFPRITPLDQAAAHHAILQQLMEQPRLLPSPHRLTLPLFAIVGSSMGGMSTLQFATSYPTLFRRAVLICSTPLTSPSTQALRSIQRSAIRLDPHYHAGQYTTPPIEGMRLARKLGTICYRSRGEMDRRFTARVRSDGSWQVEGYLNHVSWGFASRYDANCYLLLSECMDRMDVGQYMEAQQSGGGGRGEAGEVWLSADDSAEADDTYQSACERIAGGNSEWLIFPITEDALIPAEESDRLAAVLGSCGAKVHHERISSVYGHDAFLKEGEVLNPRLHAFLTDGDMNVSGVENVRRYVDELYKL